MASEEIEVIGSSSNSSSEEIHEVIGSSSNSSCVIQVGYARIMKEEDVLDVNEALIFRVPEPVQDSNDQLYTPQFVSIGPFHYEKTKLKGMEKSKDEAVRRMQIRIQKTRPNITIKSFVEEEMLPKDKEIRKFYGEHISFSPIEFAWMVTRDACFIFEFLANYLRWGSDTQDFYEKEVEAFSFKYDPVFDVILQNPLREGLMNDILLFENQIPLWVLKVVLQTEVGTLEAAGQKLDELAELVLRQLIRHSIFMWYVLPSHKIYSSHFLELIYRGMVGKDIKSYDDREAYKMRASRNKRFKNIGMQVYFKKGVDSINAFCRHWCKHSPSSDSSQGNVQQTSPSSNNCTQVYFNKGFYSIKAIYGRCCKLFLHFPSSNTRQSESVQMDFVKLPTALELTRAGVNIYPVTPQNRPVDIGSAIDWVRFDEKTAVLYLPEIMVTQQLYSVISNFIAMELSKEMYFPRPMTQYMLFMDELIDSEEDVAVLRKAEVINNFLKSNKQAADFFNTVGARMTHYRSCKVIYEARRGLYKYRKRRYKILWSEFVSAYFSKPWVVAGSIAAVLLLWMTMAQVLCLFINCNPSSIQIHLSSLFPFLS